MGIVQCKIHLVEMNMALTNTDSTENITSLHPMEGDNTKQVYNLLTGKVNDVNGMSCLQVTITLDDNGRHLRPLDYEIGLGGDDFYSWLVPLNGGNTDTILEEAFDLVAAREDGLYYVSQDENHDHMIVLVKDNPPPKKWKIKPIIDTDTAIKNV